MMTSYGMRDKNLQAFFIKDEQTKKYALNIAFYKTETRAQSNCNSLIEKGLTCDVKAFEFEL